MPRIAAAILVFVLITFSIGLNISRYPMVWEMVGASGNLSQPEETSSSDAATQTDETEPAALSDNEEQVAEAEQHQSPMAANAAPPEPIKDVTRDNGYRPVGSQRLSDPAEQNESASVPDDSLVPIPEVETEEVETEEVQRLPSVDPQDPASIEAHVSRGNEGPIPFYPNTGI